MPTSELITVVLIVFPILVLVIYTIVILIGNHTILRAGGQTAHENYPKVVEKLRTVFVIIFISSLLFFLVIFNYVPSDVLVTLVSVGVGVAGTLLLKKDNN